MWKSPIPGLLAILMLTAAAGADPARKSTGFDPALLDLAADPCQDFYQHACGGWLKANPIPEDRGAWSKYAELYANNMAAVTSVLDKVSADDPARKPHEQKTGDYFASCMDEAGIEARGTAPLQGDLAAVEAVADGAGLARVVARLHQAGVDAVFVFGSVQNLKGSDRVIAGVAPAGISLPGRDFYVQSDPKSVEVRDKYAAHIRRMFELLGDAPETAEARAKAALRVETALAGGWLSPVELREPGNLFHLMKRSDLARLAPAFDWDAYIAAVGAVGAVGAPAFEEMNIAVPRFLEAMAAELRSAPLADWKSYLRWRLVNESAPALPAAFVQENFNFFRKTLSGSERLQPRWARCFQDMDINLGEALGQVYVEAAFSEASRRRTETMVAALIKALERDLRELDWMGEATRREALVKLAGLDAKIGYPKTWRDYGGLRIVRGDALGNRQRGKGFELQRQIARIGKPFDRQEWATTPATVNAYYEGRRNDVTFPAGILQPPFFDPRLDDAANLGAIGTVIGHELTHGFDDEGRQFDAKGNLRDWWAPEDARRFQERASCLEAQFSQYPAIDDLKVNGKLTLGENIGDLGGLRIAYMALQDTLAGKEAPKIGGFTPEQRLFLAYGQAMCENARPEVVRRRTLSDPHAPSRYRVNGVVANLPEFQRAFGCKAGQPMVRENVCRVW
ncbi:MAG TPA: M13 family metallopeptidase [Thermoanaerobaculia bacterium]|nr:M13 family metallopeptidase [Thermoanaerobaculia bacterium]